MPKKRIYPKISITKKSFDISYNKISTEDWRKGSEYAIWLAGVRYAERKYQLLIRELMSEKAHNQRSLAK